MRVVILCGGKGTRMGNSDLPKALFPIGGKPILWHIVNMYSQYGINDFIFCLGYKGRKIISSFPKLRGVKIEFVDTGLETNTGGRIKRISHLIKDDSFFATYGDGLSDINLKNLLGFHKNHKTIATITVAKPSSPFGMVDINPHSQLIVNFEEKPVLNHWINGGFFVFTREIFNYLRKDDVLERDTFGRLVKIKQICAFKHRGFWRCMDTYKDNLELNEIWKQGKAPWRAC